MAVGGIIAGITLGVEVYKILEPLIRGWINGGTGPDGAKLTPEERDALRLLVDQLEAQVLANARRDKEL